MDRTSRLAIAGSLLWVALATAVILGTHGEALADAPGLEPDRTSSEWLAHPVSDELPHAESTLWRQC